MKPVKRLAGAHHYRCPKGLHPSDECYCERADWFDLLMMERVRYRLPPGSDPGPRRVDALSAAEAVLRCYRGACNEPAHPCGYNRETHGLYCLDCANLISGAAPGLRLFPLWPFAGELTPGGAWEAGLVVVRGMMAVDEAVAVVEDLAAHAGKETPLTPLELAVRQLGRSGSADLTLDRFDSVLKDLASESPSRVAVTWNEGVAYCECGSPLHNDNLGGRLCPSCGQDLTVEVEKVETPPATPHEATGMAWWNGLPKLSRKYWLTRAGGDASAADAYVAFLRAEAALGRVEQPTGAAVFCELCSWEGTDTECYIEVLGCVCPKCSGAFSITQKGA